MYNIHIYIYIWSKHTGCSKFWGTELLVHHLACFFQYFPCHSGAVWHGLWFLSLYASETEYVRAPACLAAWSWRWHISSIQYSVCLPQSDATTRRSQAQTGLSTSNEKRAQLQKLGTGKEDQDGQVTILMVLTCVDFVFLFHMIICHVVCVWFSTTFYCLFQGLLLVQHPSQSKVWPHATAALGIVQFPSSCQVSVVICNQQLLPWIEGCWKALQLALPTHRSRPFCPRSFAHPVTCLQ